MEKFRVILVEKRIVEIEANSLAQAEAIAMENRLDGQYEEQLASLDAEATPLT